MAWVQHTEAGSEGATVATFTNNAAQVSAYAAVSLQGVVDLFGPPTDSYWANGILEAGNLWQRIVAPAEGIALNANPNYWTLNCESEDLGSGATPVSQAEYDAVRWALNGAMEFVDVEGRRYGDHMHWLLRHTDISPLSRPNCCGQRWTSGRFQDLANEFGLRTTAPWWSQQVVLSALDLQPFDAPQVCLTAVVGQPGGRCGHFLESHLAQLASTGGPARYGPCGCCACTGPQVSAAVELVPDA